MRLLLIIAVLLLAQGCQKAPGQKISPAEEAQRRDVFWQFQEPRIQLDPIEEEETPSAFSPASPGAAGEE